MARSSARTSNGFPRPDHPLGQPASPEPDEDLLEDFLLSLKTRLEGLVRSLGTWEVRVDELLLQLHELRRRFDRSRNAGSYRMGHRFRRGWGDQEKLHQSVKDVEGILRKAACQGVSRVEMEKLASGRAVVGIGESASFELSPKLALLLEIIRDGDPKPDSEEPLAPWKSLDEVARRLQLAFGEEEPLSRNRIRQLIHRLRRAFEANLVNPFIVETRPGAVRLACRR
ncbi:MAG: hypothetical protein ACE5GW_13455 [Planctomycetota bacterium]